LLYLLISLLILLVTPLLHLGVSKLGKPYGLFERLLFILVTVLVLVHILPDAYEIAGWPVLIVALVGWGLPGFLERNLHHMAGTIHGAQIVVAIIGLGLHGVLDGVGLSLGDIAEVGHEARVHTHVHSHAHDSLPLAILLHRVPEALFLWWVLKPKYGFKIPSAVLAFLGLSTIFGFWFGHEWLSGFENGAGFGYFQALVGGSLMHLASHRPHDHSDDHAH
jgi:hypothetical protein